MWSRIAHSLSLSPWYDTPQGAYALEREKILLQNVLSPWPRRGHSLLEMGCGDGLFLEFFWQAGFDMTAIDRASPLLDTARQRLHGRADIQAGALDALPFADNTFDYVSITSPLPVPAPPRTHDPAEQKSYAAESLVLAQNILREAVRVSAKGLVLRCWNPFSMAGLWRYAWLCPGAAPHGWSPPEAQETQSEPRNMISEGKRALWLGWRDYRGMLRALSPGCSISTRSTLCGPPPTWHPGKLLRYLNEWESPLPLGAVVYLRVNHQTQCPFTSLPLRLSLHLKSTPPAAAMERGHEYGATQDHGDRP